MFSKLIFVIHQEMDTKISILYVELMILKVTVEKIIQVMYAKDNVIQFVELLIPKKDNVVIQKCIKLIFAIHQEMDTMISILFVELMILKVIVEKIIQVMYAKDN
jgi:hypothetical protein